MATRENNGKVYRVVYGNGAYHMQCRVNGRYETMQAFGTYKAAVERLDQHIEYLNKEADKTETLETCVECQSVIGFKEAKENAEWLLEECDYTLDEGPHCGCCARKRRAQGK